VVLPDSYADEIRKSLLAERALPQDQLPSRIEILFDPTPESAGGFSAEDLSQLIVSPRAGIRSRRVSFIFVLDGFLIEIFVPTASKRERRRPGMLKEQSKLYVPSRNVFDVPELVQLMTAGFAKHAKGLESDSIKQRR
jgi:hypothetical protein